MATPLPAAETVVDLTADDGEDEPEVSGSGPSLRTSTSTEPGSRSTTSHASPDKQLLDATLQRSQQLLAARLPSRSLPGDTPPGQPTSAEGMGASATTYGLTSPSKQSVKNDRPAPSVGRGKPSSPVLSRKLSTPVVLSSSSSVGDAAEPEPRRSSRTSSARRPSAPPTNARLAARSGQASGASIEMAEVALADPSASVYESAEAGLIGPRSPSAIVSASSNTIQSVAGSRAQTPSPKPSVPAPYFAELGSTPRDIKPIIAFVPPSASRPLRVIKDDAGQDVIDLEDTDDEEQSDGDDDDEDEDSDDDVENSGGEHLGPSDGEGLNTEDDGRATGDDSGAEGDEDDEEEDDDGETDADVSAMEIDNHLLDGADGAVPNPGGLEAKLDALHEANTSPRSAIGTPQRNASAGPSNHNGPRVPGFQSGSSEFTSPASSVVPRSGAASKGDGAHHPVVKKKIKRARANSPTTPAVPVKPDITLRLEHPIKLNEYTDFSLYEKALNMGQYDEATVAHFSPGRILQAVQAKRDLDAKHNSKKRKRSSGVALANETPEEILARGLEEKYGAKKKKHTVNKEDYYDLDDGFVDDSTAMVDVPEYAGIPVEEGFYVAVGAIELRGEEEEEPDERHFRKPRKGSVDSSSDAASKPKAPIKRRQTNLSHLLQGDDGDATGAGLDGEHDVEVADGQAVSATSAPIPLTSIPLGTPVFATPAASNGFPTSTIGSSAAPAAMTTHALPPPTSVSNPVILSSSSTNEAPAERPVVKQQTPAEPSLSQRPKAASVKPEAVIPTALISLVQELRQKIKEHDWSNKKVFPEHLRPIIHRLVEAAIGVDWYGQDFFDLMPKIFPYNRFTMLKLIRRQEFPFHEALLQKQRARLVEQWRHEVDAEAKIQVPRYQAALKDWEEKKGRAPYSINGPPGSPSALTSHGPGTGADAGPPPVLPASTASTNLGPTDARSPDLGLSQLPFINGGPPTPNAKSTSDDKVPQRKMRLTSKLRETLWTLFNITEEILELTNEVNSWESKKPESGLKLRKTLYSDLASCFPEGFVHTTDLSRAVSQLKLKYERKDDPVDD